MLSEHISDKFSSANVKYEIWYRIWEDLDKEEGRGGRKLRHIINDSNHAKTLSKGLGVYGADGFIEKIELLRIHFNDGYEILIEPLKIIVENELRNSLLKVSALNKLTSEELKALTS